ncbi:bis(5-adenosyl)-triphosphatase-like [Stylonychia lemnae]|uniref:Bis(5-adenosyl)-triphosphatase-like n=1 Tax=Stylonychia lemnae TaxID=5949 RepID=A0A078B237_STYLE|nr:bis(5-adenosyl)-triphosphatase-like [Stylonychia lemnae]|eukprot:CDW88331.1 bis(5-adenosyl)-triphosphatase-like [Stylonychia lemnae]
MAPITFRFGDKIIPSQHVFISRKHVYAMIYDKAIAPGHVLVCPTRQVQQFKDLTELETLELFVCAKEIANKFKDFFKMKSFSFVIQDGEQAGQQTKHVHLHIIPRDDNQHGYSIIKFNNVPERSASDMAEEADELKIYFDKRDEIQQFNKAGYI